MSQAGDKKGRDTDAYEKKSDRIHAWSTLLKSFSKLLWAVAVVILLAGLGKMFLFKSVEKKSPREITKQAAAQVDWSKVDREVAAIMAEARKNVEKKALLELDKWIDENMERVDADFLDWYFGYWTQQKLGLQALLSEVIHWVDNDSPNAAAQITQEVQSEFSNRVLRPVIAQQRIERIIDSLVKDYAEELKSKLDFIPGKYNIPQVVWDRYLENFSVLIRGVEADRQTPLALKTIVGIAAGGTFAAVVALRPLVTKISGRISGKLAAKSAAGMATKTGGKVAARAGGKFLGTIVAVGIIIWDVWDHYSNKKKAMPVLRKNIFDYFQELKHSLLHDPQFGIITVFYQLEKDVSKGFQQSP